MRPKHFRFLVFLLNGSLIVATTACQEKPQAEEVVPSTDRVGPSPLGTSQNILHKTFSVRTSATFPFEIPPHASTPHLHGQYKSFLKESGQSGGRANVDFLILNEDQYADFIHRQSGETVFATEASHDQEVEVGLPASQERPLKFFLVFRNSSGEKTTKLVQADFTVDF